VSAAGVSGEPDPDALLAAVREAAGPPPLPPLSLAEPPPSARSGPAGVAVTRARRALVRILAPILADLVSQLERDRHRQRAEIVRLERRVADLEARLARDEGGEQGGAPGGAAPRG